MSTVIMKIISLSENTSNKENIGAEHGLSLYIEANGKKILFDFGASDLFVKNAVLLGVDLARVDFAILSHGHSDHGGGLSAFLELNSYAPVYVSPYAFEPHYNARGEYIGLDPLLANEKRLKFVESKEFIDTGLCVFNCNRLPSICAPAPTGHTKVTDGKHLIDDYVHEQYLVVTEGSKRILISGCSHKGIVNIMEWVKPTHLVGGFHFSRLPLDERLLEYADRLNEYDTNYYTCHCTGREQFELMRSHMKNLCYLSAGEEITI